jgi:hypothetical protein
VNPVKFSGIALGIAGGALNTGGLNRIRGRVQAEKNFGKLSLATQGLVEHAFQAGADGVDVYASVGASYEVASGLGAGIEYTAQDIEALVGDDAEGGARQMFGPTMVWHPQAMPVRLLFGPAVAIGPEGTRAVGRMTFSYSF